MARRPLSLTAYLALTKGRVRASGGTPVWPDRPDGLVLWLHADTPARLRVLLSLAKRLEHQIGPVYVLATCEIGALSASAEDDIPVYPVPNEVQYEIERFLRHWSPSVCLWAGTSLRPALIYHAAERGCCMILADAQETGWRLPKAQWIPDASAATFMLFDKIFAVSDAAVRRLRRLGYPDAQIEELGLLDKEVLALPCPEDLHREMAAVMAGRPVWLAAHVHLDEASAVIRAHRRASRLAHRLLLVLVPDHPEDEAEIAAIAHDAGVRVAFWENGDMPDENTQMLLARDKSELGLWYRLSPLCFLGGSLVNHAGGNSPMMAAVLGSAVLYGPNVGQHLEDYSQLVEAGAARIVKDTDSLHTAVSFLIAPDRSAAMAHAGWQVVAARAAINDRVVQCLADALDAAEVAA